MMNSKMDIRKSKEHISVCFPNANLTSWSVYSLVWLYCVKKEKDSLGKIRYWARFICGEYGRSVCLGSGSCSPI
ncbi:hypothetical protein ACSQ67_000139 [Phaseolus vulgaris]